MKPRLVILIAVFATGCAVPCQVKHHPFTYPVACGINRAHGLGSAAANRKWERDAEAESDRAFQPTESGMSRTQDGRVFSCVYLNDAAWRSAHPYRIVKLR